MRLLKQTLEPKDRVVGLAGCQHTWPCFGKPAIVFHDRGEIFTSEHVIVADPGAGKTMGIRDMIKTAGSRTILAVTTPKNNEDEQALGDHTVRESIPFQKELLLSDQPLKLNDRSIEKKRSICVTLL